MRLRPRHLSFRVRISDSIGWRADEQARNGCGPDTLHDRNGRRHAYHAGQKRLHACMRCAMQPETFASRERYIAANSEHRTTAAYGKQPIKHRTD